MIHIFEDGRTLNVLRDLVPYIKYKGIEPRRVCISSITCNGLDISEESPRYKAADVSFPVVLQTTTTGYKLIDGRHRLLKKINTGHSVISAYVLSEYEINLFKK